MADTVVNSALEVEKWSARYFEEFVRTNRFTKYQGVGSQNIIVLIEELGTGAGQSINVPLVGRLTGAGVTGNAVLEGNEEALDLYNHKIEIDWLRNAVVTTKKEERRTLLDILGLAKPRLKTWAMENYRDAVITALGSKGGVAYGTASEAEKDTWTAANADRVLFGAAKSNNSSNDHSASLANIDNTADKLTPSVVSLAKRMAQTATPKIGPIQTNDESGEEWYVMFANPLAFRDLANNTTMTQANRDAWTRGRDNPLFTGGDLIWDGVIIREIPEIGVITGAGAGGIDVAPNYLCGVQAVGVAWGQRPRATENVTDYGFRKGVGVEELRGVEKLVFQSSQDHGVVTVYTAAVADA